MADRWSDEVYVVAEQPNKDIPEYVVKKEGRERTTKTLHRSMLLPVNILPLPLEVSATKERTVMEHIEQSDHED